MKPPSASVQVIALEKKNDRWQGPFLPMEGMIGRKGFASPGEKREGDGRTPSGIFPLGTVFGYEPSFPTMMPYRQVTTDDLWVDDIHAADYNRLVQRGSTRASSFEVMKRDDDLYKYGIVVEYNTDPVIKGYGSAIFFHLWRGRETPTEGCIALSEEDLMRILRWLNPEAKPLAVMGADVTIDNLGK
jgi:L,D-peptidoglycan transpeptidase YkuD (ErfK/YbiS/YcfS/YnhG family)